MKSPQPAPVTDWSQEPLIVSLERVAEIFGMKPRTIQERIKANRFTQPMYTRPMRWSRADLERAWNGSMQSANKRRLA